MPKAYMSLALVTFAFVSPKPPGWRISGLHHLDALNSAGSSTSSDPISDSRRSVAEARPAILAIPWSSIRTFVWKYNQYRPSSRTKHPYTSHAAVNDVQGVDVVETPGNLNQLIAHAHGSAQELYDRTKRGGSLISTSKHQGC